MDEGFKLEKNMQDFLDRERKRANKLMVGFGFLALAVLGITFYTVFAMINALSNPLTKLLGQ